MIQLTKIEDLKGKVIVNAVTHYKNVSLLFMDETFAVFSIDSGYGDDSPELIFCENLEDYVDLEDQRDLKIITETEYRALEYKRREEFNKAQEERDRKLFEQLKKKFGA